MNDNKRMIIPVFVPHKGCPFDCIYCNQKIISGQQEEMTPQRARETIESYLATARNKKIIDIGFYGGSFTGIDYNEQIGLLEVAYDYLRKGLVDNIRLSTRPDYINDHILSYLKEYGVDTIELGVQSLDDEVLRKSCRGHTADDVITAVHLIKANGFKLGIQTMIGLPGDSREKDVWTAFKVAEMRPDVVRIYPTLVIKETYLEKMYREGKYAPLSLEEAVSICADLLDIYKSNGINVIRVGLQTTDTINENMDVVTGPFHPAFRQLVESRLILREIENEIIRKGLAYAENISIYAPSNKISDIRGQKNSNIEYLKKKYQFNSVTVKADDNLHVDFMVVLKLS